MLPGCPSLYRNKLQEQGVQNVINRNKVKFEPDGDLFEQNFSQFNENSINNQGPLIQIENDEATGAEDTETNRNKL